MNLDVYLKELEELVNIDSGSKMPKGVDRVCNLLSKSLKDLILL